MLVQVYLLPGDGVGWKLMGRGALETDNRLALSLAVVHLVRVVADVLLGVVGKALAAGGLISYAGSALFERKTKREKKS